MFIPCTTHTHTHIQTEVPTGSIDDDDNETMRQFCFVVIMDGLNNSWEIAAKIKQKKWILSSLRWLKSSW